MNCYLKRVNSRFSKSSILEVINGTYPARVAPEWKIFSILEAIMARRRMIDPGIWDGGQFSRLNFRQRVLYIGTISLADDEGIMRGNPPLVRSKIFAYDDIPVKTIEKDLLFLKEIGLIWFWKADDGNEYIQHPKWNDYQRIDKPYPSKYPNYSENRFGNHSNNHSKNGSKNGSNNHSENGSRPKYKYKRSLKRSLKEEEVKNKKRNTFVGEDGKTPSSPTAQEPIKQPPVSFNYGTFTFENITETMITKWAESFPAVDIHSEIKKIEAWLMSNPKRQIVDYRRFINNWMKKAQHYSDGRAGYKKSQTELRQDQTLQAGDEWLKQKGVDPYHGNA